MDLNLDLSAKPGRFLKLSSPPTTKSQVWEQAEKQEFRLQSSKVKERFISFLEEKTHHHSKKDRKKILKWANQTNLTPQALGTLPLRQIIGKVKFSKDTRLGWPKTAGAGRLDEKAFKIKKITFPQEGNFTDSELAGTHPSFTFWYSSVSNSLLLFFQSPKYSSVTLLKAQPHT